MKKFLISLFVGVSGTALLGATAQTKGYYSDPTFNRSVVVFQSEADLWRVPVEGGLALRLTTHPEEERNPVLSPNGQKVAFEARYDGSTEIYVMSVAGGLPERVTFEGGGVSLRGWMDDGRILYTSTNVPGTIPRQLRIVDLNAQKTSDVKVADADQTALSGDGKTLFFTRYGLNMFSDNAIMYRGGRMAQLWKFELGGEDEAQRLAADFGAPIREPMWWDGRIYFLTDKSGADNIWSMADDGTDLRQHTQSERWQMRGAALHDGVIMYQSGADLKSYSIADNKTETLNISLLSDSDYQRDRWLSAPFAYFETARMSPDGKAVTATARGKFVTGFTNDRRRIEYDIPEGARARSATLNHDGKWLYTLLDHGKSGEIWRFPADGSGKGEPVATDFDTYIWGIWPSPHDESLLYSDKKGRLFSLNVETGEKILIDQTTSSSDYAFGGFNWSAKGRYLSYYGYDKRDIPQVVLYDTKQKQKTVLTSGKFESYAPTISPDGKWLYFISDRNFKASPRSPWGDRNMGPAFEDRSLIYALQLDPEARFPFTPDDELSLAKAASKKEEKKDEKKEGDTKKSKDKKGKKNAKSEEKPKVDAGEKDLNLSGIQDRLWQVPVPAGNYASLIATAKHLYVLERTEPKQTLKRIALTNEKPKLDTFTSDVTQMDLSADGKTLFVQKGSRTGVSFYLVDAGKGFPSDTTGSKVGLSDWKLKIDPKDEWKQMAHDAWRLHRDFAFDRNLRSVDWGTVGERYLPMAERIGHRLELNDLLSLMSSELGILHSQVRTGDVPRDSETGSPSYLGAEFLTVPEGLKITNILKGENDRLETLGPLSKPGVDIVEGDIITAIDGKPVRSEKDIATELMGKQNKQVLVDYQRGGDAKKEIITPVSWWAYRMLYYTDWVETNRAKVAAEGKGEIGYLHLRAMGSNDIASFARDFYEHFDKDGLIIDVRGNRGGNIDSWIIATLLRQSWAFWKGLEGGPYYTNMQQAFRGHLVVLIDEGTYSDGETFAAGVKALNLAPLIGTRTAGAGIWLSDRNRLVDGGQARVAEYAQYGMDGRWLLEGLGVEPDIKVDTDPHATYLGKDAQLETALKYLQDKIASDPIPELKPKPIPKVGTPGQDVK